MFLLRIALIVRTDLTALIARTVHIVLTARIAHTATMGRTIVYFGLCPCQHNGTYTRNVHPATPTKKPAQILRFAESKKEPLSRKILGKAARNALGKGTGPSNLSDTAVGIFLSRLKKWVQKSPEVVETSGLFAAASFLVQLDGCGRGI